MSFLGLNLFRRSGTITAPTPGPIENDEVEEGLDIAISFLGTGTEVEEKLNSANLITTALAAATSPSHNEGIYTTQKASSSLRKVTFESLNECDYHYSSSPSRVLSPLRALPPSRERPARSILKPFKPSSLNHVTQRTFGSFQEMLDNTVRQLAAGDQKNRIDAYQSFLGAIQAKISVPEQDALLDATPSLLEFVYRDVQNASSQNLQIVTWALKFLATLTRMIPIAEQPEFDGLTSLLDFAINFIEMAVNKAIKDNSVVENAGIPKVVIHHHLLYLCQKFNPKILTPERAARVLTCLSKIHERVNGNNVKVYRLVIYQQFFEVVPNTMISKAAEWLPNLFNCLLSNKAEVRQHAMNLGLTASLRHARQLCKSVEDILSSKNEETRFMDLFIEQLSRLLEHKDREMALIVPRVWATMVLFLRPRFKKPEFWSWFKPFLTLLSQAMNSMDRQVKLETYAAWKRFIFAVMPDKHTISQVRKMLRSPFQDALLNQRELQQGPGRTMMSGYLCLLYYSLRPGASFEDLDMYWTEYVSQILVNFASVKRNGQHLYCASSILQSLFQSSEKWNENRANSSQAFEIDELSRLDCNWIRSRLDKVLTVVEPILLHPGSWAPIDDENKSQERPLDLDNLALSTWSSLMEAVREAGAKEITISVALKSSVAATTNVLHKVGRWLAQNPPDSINPAQAFQLMTECAITRLGASSFTERMLMKNPESQDFEIAPTPSHRSKSGSLQSPITHLLALQIQLCSQSDCALELTKSVELIQSLVEQCWNSLSLRTSKLNLIGDLLGILELEYSKDGIVPQLVSETSDHLLELAEEITRPTLNGLVASTLTSKEFEAILAISKHIIAINSHGQVPKVLYEHASDAAKRSNGVGGMLLAVTEPHAAMIHEMMAVDDGSKYSVLLSYTNLIIENDSRPRNWGVVERGRRSLWGGVSVSNGASKNADLEYTNLSSLVNYALRYGYAQLRSSSGDAQTYANIFEGLCQYLNRSPPLSSAIFLRQIQSGVSYVLSDCDFHIRDYSGDRGKQSLLHSILSFWTSITQYLRTQKAHAIEAFEEFIVAGLTSPRRSIVNTTITFWNDILLEIGESPLECSERIIQAVQQLYHVADIRLPYGIEPDDQSETAHALSYFEYSQRSPEFLQKSLSTSFSKKPRKTSPPKHSKRRGKVVKSSKETPRRRPRHEDSQIVFEAVESSPMVQDSQALTDHQKEVAERQLSDAAIFPDIHSTPRPSNNKLIIKSNVQAQLDSDLGNQSDVLVGSSDQEEPQSSPPSSPHFGPNHLQSDDQPPSSPVVASIKRKRNHSFLREDVDTAQKAFVTDLSAYDIPSSPPSVVRHQSHDLMNSHLTEESDMVASTQSNTQITQQLDVGQTPTNRTSPVVSTITNNVLKRKTIAATQSLDLDLRAAQLEEELVSLQDSSQPTQVNVSSVNVLRAAPNTSETHNETQHLNESVVKDSFIVPASPKNTSITTESYNQAFASACPVSIQVIQENSIGIDTTAPQNQGLLTTSQDSNLSSHSSRRLRRRKSPSAVAEEEVQVLDNEPARKKHKSMSHHIILPTQDENLSPADGVSVLVASSLSVVQDEVDQEVDVVNDKVEQPPSNTKTILERMRDLVTEAHMVESWSLEEQIQVANLAFEMQAAVRGLSLG